MRPLLKTALKLSADSLPVFKWLPEKLRIVMYHGVGCSHFSEEAFELQMKFISKHFETFWVSEAMSLLDENSNVKSTKPPIILTFDDGLLNNKITAAPILEKYGLKATFFVCSDLIDGKSMMWNREIRCRLSLMDTEDIRKMTDGLCADNTNESIYSFVELVKSWSKVDVKALLTSLREEFPNPEYTDQMLRDGLIMKTEDLINLPECIEIGSHTRSHPILNTLGEEEIENEVKNSKSILSELLNKSIDVFCYPNGASNEYCQKVVSEHYSIAVTTEEGFASSADGFHSLKRIPSAEKLQDLVWRLVRPTG